MAATDAPGFHPGYGLRFRVDMAKPCPPLSPFTHNIA